jgi:hypothetical protein
MRQVMLYISTNLRIIYTVYPLYTFTNSTINFDILTLNVPHLLNTPTAGVNYKELYGCKWDPMTLTNNIMYEYTSAFQLL